MKRRTFCGGVVAAAALGGALNRAALAAGNTIVVAIAQAGGNDALNTVVPLAQYGAYSALRTPSVAPGDPTLALNLTQASLAATAFDANPSTAAASATQYALNPVMTSMRALYATGHLAVVTGSGVIPDEPNRFSHEVGQFDWATGSIKQLGFATAGWLGSALDGAAGGPIGATVSLTGRLEQVLIGRSSEPLALGVPIDAFALSVGGTGADTAARAAGFSALQHAPSYGDAAAFVRALSGAASASVAAVQTIAQKTATFDYVKPRSFLESQLREIARLITGGAGARAYYAVHGGYDTHRSQNKTHPQLLGELSDGIATFYAYLRAKGASANVLVMTYSDFGRRARANDSYGTDHGSAMVNFIAGDPVQGGVYGQYPDLSSLDATGNLKIQVDFRNVLSDVVTYLGADPSTIVGKTYPKLGFV